MKNIINKSIQIDRDICDESAKQCFFKVSGINRKDEKHQKMEKQAFEIRDVIADRIDVKAVYSYYEDISCGGDQITIGGQSFECNAFGQIDPQSIEGAYVYMVTAGDFTLDERPIMEQLLADLWGTAYVEAGRMYLSEEFRRLCGSAGNDLSDSFGPGFYGLGMEAIHELTKLADNDAIGVEVRDTGIMVPVKSCAGIIFCVNSKYKKMDAACADCLGSVSSCKLCNIKSQKPKEKNFKCTGVCAECGRCKGANMISGANDRKTKMLMFPDDFRADTDGNGFGVAFDIGTTTVVGMLWDLESGEYIGAEACTNPQNEFGLDVISRITFCGKEPGNLAVIRNKIVGGLNGLIGSLCKNHGIERNEIVKVTVSGNTTMSHLFAGYDPGSLALAPFEPAYTGSLELPAQEAKLDMNENGRVYVLPNIAGHVGGDITAGIVAARIAEQKQLTLFLDVGTNGEIVLAEEGRAVTCSTAAGPAFEGASIYQGMRAASGAIEKVEIRDGDVFFKTVESCEPTGICGSGLIDAVAQMIKAGLINKTGRILSAEDFKKKYAKNCDDSDRDRIGESNAVKLSERIREGEAGREFVLVFKEKKEDIVITQKDIREVQLAKGAIAAGISILLENMGRTAENIDKVVIAGAFGNFIDRESAKIIGLLPDVDTQKIVSAGNAAGAGVSMVLVSKKEMDAALAVPSGIEHIELAECSNFQDIYMKKMGFMSLKV